MATVNAPTRLNGGAFSLSREGEEYKQGTGYEVWFPDTAAGVSFPCSPRDDCIIDAPRQVTYTGAQFQLFFNTNYNKLTADVPALSITQKSEIVFLRFRALCEGLISLQFATGNHHVNHTDAHRLLYADVNYAVITGSPADAAAVNTFLTQRRQDNYTQNFADLACLVALEFRKSGHHYTDDLLKEYAKVFGKLRYTADEGVESFANIATFALHGIFPDILDAFWVQMATQGTINGALITRINTAPAGRAVFHNVISGISDIMAAAPGIRIQQEEGMEYLEILKRDLGGFRWKGSINARLYGEDRYLINESRLAALAASIVAIYDEFATTSQLLGSKSLKRAAGGAPVVGGVMGKLFGAYIETLVRSQGAKTVAAIEGERKAEE